MAAIAAAILAAAALLIWLVILPAVQPKAKGSPYISENGEIYTIENMQQPVENISGKAYLMVNPSVQINHGETMDYYIFDFRYHEINGIAPLWTNRMRTRSRWSRRLATRSGQSDPDMISFAAF